MLFQHCWEEVFFLTSESQEVPPCRRGGVFCFLVEQLVLEMKMRLLGAGKGGQGFDRGDMEGALLRSTS